MDWINGGVTAARGFRASGVFAGIKRSRKPDLALLVADGPCTAAGVFTRNRIQAAPVVISRRRLARGRARAVLVNSGSANCLTGSRGLADALRLGRRLAMLLDLPEGDVLLASTGLIGRRLPVEKMARALPKLVGRLSRAHHEAAAQAILTTDLRTKEVAVEARFGGRVVRVGGMAKGAGMIAPSMATMLALLTTDAALAPGLLRRLLRGAIEGTFNRISVDGDMSTNDSVFVLASGRSGVAIRAGTARERIFQRMLEAVAERLATRIVHDGEGSTRVMAVEVVGARSDREALACARQVALSPLVKTMLAGSDPNVGRIAAAAGASSARFNPSQLDIQVGAVPLVSRGAAVSVPAAVMRRLLARPRVPVRINLHAGSACGRMLTCDFTEEYVRINAGYAT
jgi:glutamate N-acetyltransferase/amino-acid N-acetyltransferase